MTAARLGMVTLVVSDYDEARRMLHELLAGNGLSIYD